MIALIGCGRSGLPLALKLADTGIRVIGVESDPARRLALTQGHMPFTEEGTQELLSRTLGKTFEVVGGIAEAARRAEVFIVAVNSPLDDRMLPVLDHIEDLAFSVLSPAKVVTDAGHRPALIIRSTVYPGFSARLISHIESRFELTVGTDFHYAYCPDRCAPGQSLEELSSLPQIIGAFDESSRKRAMEVFSRLQAPILATGPLEGELAKLFNNAYRYVNFALANECLLLADAFNANARESFRAATEGYERGAPPLPGYAGGPCLYKDGFFLNWGLPGTELLLTSWKLNEGLADHLVQRVERLRPISRPVILGLGYKEGSDDSRFSPGERIARLLNARGLSPIVHDPSGQWPNSIPSINKALAAAGEIFVAVPDPAYRQLSWHDLEDMVRPGAILADPWLLWGQPQPVVRMEGRASGPVT